MTMHARPRFVRGNALMLTLIALTVLMVLVGGAIQFTNRNREAAVEKIRGERIGMCADAARRHLLSRLSLQQSPISSLELLDTRLIDDTDPEARTLMKTGHRDTRSSESPDAVSTIIAVPEETMGTATKSISGVGNKSLAAGSRFFRVVVKCEEPSDKPEYRGRQSEVEFLFSYGLRG